MRVQRQLERQGYLLLITLGAIVLAFMSLSLAITATGTARFAVAMGYRAQVGYVVGAIFDFAKALLPVALLVLLTRRAFLFFVHYRVCLGLARHLQRARDACDGEHRHGRYRALGFLEDGSAVRHKGRVGRR